MFDLLLDLVDSLVLVHQFVGVLNLVLLLLEKGVRVVDLVSQSDQLFLLLSQTFL